MLTPTRPPIRALSLTTAVLATAILCAAAAIAPAHTLAAVATAPTPTAPATPTSQPPPAPTPVAGKVKLVLQRVGGRPPFALLGQRVVVRGIVTPYVGGQTVRVSFYRDGRKVRVQTVSVLALGNGTGQFHVNYLSGSPGLVQARVAHYATAQQSAFVGRSPGVQYVTPNLGPGGR